MEGEPQGIEETKPVPVPLGAPVMPSPIRALCYTLASCGVGGFSHALLRDYDDWASPYWIGMTYAAAIVATLGLGLVAIIAWWRYGAAAQRASRGKPQGIEATRPVPVPLGAPVMPSPIRALGYSLGACGLGALTYALLRDDNDWGSPLWAGTAFALAIVATLGLALAAIVAWWRYGAAAQRASHWLWRWPVLKIVCVVGVIGLLPVGLVAAAWASFEYREAVERQRMSDFHIRWIAARSEIYIRGSIGPGLADKLLHLLAQEPTARRIVIASPGGWVKEAMMTASLVAKRGTDVVAREICNSACILVLLAAHKRYADWDMVFGFHIPVDLVPNRDGTFARASSAGVKFIEGFMTGHHVPGWIIADMERAGPNHVAAISAIQLAEENLLTGLLDGDAPVTLNQAKWLWVERMVTQRAWDSESIPTVYRAIASQAAFVVDHYANTLYETARRSNLDLFDYSASTMMSVIAADAVAAAEDSTLASYIDSVHHQLAHLVQLSNWSACDNFLEAKTFVAPGRVPSYMLPEHAPVFVALIRSANASKWQARGSSEGQELAGRRVMEEARALVAADGVLLPPADRSARGRCLIAKASFGLLAAAPIEEARLALGWLGRYDRL